MKGFEDKILDVVSANAVRSLDKSGFSRHLDRCESPIEQLMALALLLRGDWGNDQIYQLQTLQDVVAASKASGKAILASQITVEVYRADLLVLWHHGDGERMSAFVVECDGHDFHEKTKEQAAKDKARDRLLTLAGFKILRFTGSEIWRSADACAGEVLRCLHMDWTEVLSCQYEREASGGNVHQLTEQSKRMSNDGG